ncbi:hypothetical protein KKH03_03210 [Patescibacteria group bacterium]|nr:hypothetical protein [Patescibacteria group bacterium]
MNDQQQIQQFLEDLKNSGLPDERVEFWARKMASDDFSETDENAFEAEMKAHLSRIEEDLRFVEGEKDELEEEKREYLEEALPSLREGVKAAPAEMEADFNQFKSGVLADEKVAMDAIEGIRHEKESSQIDAIRKGLSK